MFKFTKIIFLTVFVLSLVISCVETPLPVAKTETLAQQKRAARFDATMGRIFSVPTISSFSCYGFDVTVGSTHHAGIDYCGSTNDNIYATASGRVMLASNAADGTRSSTDNRGLGRTIIIAHKMPDKSNVYSLYAHLTSISSDITVGKYITKGYYLGKKGMSGGGSNNVVHLHFEMKNSTELGNVPNCTGDGCVGYVKNANLPVTSRGYFNPTNYLGTKEFYDLVLESALPSSISKSGVNIPVKITSPFSENCYVDIRLSLYDVSGNYKGDIQAYNNYYFRAGSTTLNFAKSSLSSAAGSYQLQLSYKVPNSSTWLSFPTWGSYLNPNKTTLK